MRSAQKRNSKLAAGALLFAGALLNSGCASSARAPVAGPTEHRASMVFDTPQVRAASKSMGFHFDQQSPEYARRDAALGVDRDRGPRGSSPGSRENPSAHSRWHVPSGHQGAIIRR